LLVVGKLPAPTFAVRDYELVVVDYDVVVVDYVTVRGSTPSARCNDGDPDHRGGIAVDDTYIYWAAYGGVWRIAKP
jgi:hypothetical protein